MSYNFTQEFIDIMDRVNYIAKDTGYANGLAWAYQQFENKILPFASMMK